MNGYIFKIYKPWNGKFKINGKSISVEAETHEAAHKEALRIKPPGYELGAVDVVKLHSKPVDATVPLLSHDILNKLRNINLRCKATPYGYDLLRTDTAQYYEDFGFRKQPLSEVIGLLEIGLESWVENRKSTYRALVNGKRIKHGLLDLSPYEWHKFKNIHNATNRTTKKAL